MDKLTDLIPQNLKDLPAFGNGANLEGLNLDDFTRIWAKLCAAYPRQDINAQTAEIYYELLSPYSKEQVLDAINGVIAASKWFPTVAEVIEEIKGEHQCPHNFIATELRLQKAEFISRQTMLIEAEKYADRRFKDMTEKCAELENRSIELYKRDREMLEESGLAEAQARLDAINAQIQEQERILTILKQKVKLFDQARILQADQ